MALVLTWVGDYVVRGFACTAAESVPPANSVASADPTPYQKNAAAG
jgi:hypothetical protein